jgi:hypothetical protein
MDRASVLGVSALYGLVLSLLLSGVLLAGALSARDFMVQDYPPAIRARYGPKSARGHGSASSPASRSWPS